MSNCVITNFKKEFKVPENVNNIKLDDYPGDVAVNMKNYANVVNTQTAQTGFPKPLFDVGNRSSRSLRGHAFFRDNMNSVEYIKILRENINEFEEFQIRQEDYEVTTQKDNVQNRDVETSFTQDQQASNDLLTEQENNESLFHSMPPIENQELDLDPLTFYEWKESLEGVRNTLEGLVERYTKLKDTKRRKEVYATLAQINRNLESLDPKDPKNVYESSVAEIEILEKFLTEIVKNPENAVSALDSNQLVERIDNLNRYFRGVDPESKQMYSFEELDDVEGNTVGEFFFNFKRGLDPGKAEELKARVGNLQSLYEKAQTSIVQGILMDDVLVKGLLQAGKREIELALKEGRKEDKSIGWDSKKLEEALKILESGDVEIQQLAKLFLGAASGGGILGQLLKSIRDNQLSRERGHSQARVARLSQVWTTLKNKFNHDEEGVKQFVTAKLFQRDKFGVRTKELLQKYSSQFYDVVKAVRAERNQFYSNMSEANYASYMQAEKDNFHRINPMLLSRVAEKYARDREYGKHFTYTEQEISDYEAELKASLGETMFEIEVAKAAKLIDNYVESVEDNSMEYQQAYRKNPFQFTEHFNSEQFDQKDPTTGWYLESSFTHYIPKNDEKYFNSAFAEVENGEHGDLLMDFYKDAHSLLVDYITPVFRSEGSYMHPLELLTYEDRLERESTKSKSWFGRLSPGLSALWANHASRYFDAKQIAQRQAVEEAKRGEFTKKLQLGYVGYARREHGKLVTLFENLSSESLVKKAKEVGYDTSKFPPITKTEGYERFEEDLRDSLARNEVNQNTSSNIFESIKNAAFLANDINARRASVATLEAMKSYVNTLQSGKSGKDFGMKDTGNIKAFLGSWGDNNIYGYKFSLDMNRGTDIGRISKAGRATLGVTHLNATEKKIKTFIEGEKKANNNGKDTYNFTGLDGVKYYTNAKGQFWSQAGKVKKVVDIKVMQEKYGEYLTEEMKNLGVKMTVGSAAMGTMVSIIAAQLGLSPRGGMRNRLQGVAQTLSVAASGRYGFNEKQYHAARRLLRGTNTRKYLLANQFKNSKRGKKIETVKMFQEAMQIKQNRADELALEGKFDSVGGTVADKLKTFWMDFSINNPEWHNQSEIMLSVLQTVKVQDNNGDWHSFFDGESQDLIYKPGTMELKDEFDNAENQAMWVEFKESPIGQADSLSAISKIKTAVQQTQGNYDNNDVIMAQNSLAGKISTMYQRYLFENLNMNWGEHKIDLRTGEFNIKGRKVALMEHAPTAGMYLMGMHGIQLGAALVAGIGLFPAAVGVLSIAAIPAAIAWKRKSLNFRVAKSSEELGLSIDFAREVAIRTINTPVEFLSYGKASYKKSRLAELVGDKEYNGELRHEKRNLTKKERELISESAQDLATKVFVYAGYTTSLLVLKALWLMTKASLGWEDDDEEGKKSDGRKVFEKVADIDSVLNAFVNDRNTIMSELEKFTHPDKLLDEGMSFSYFSTIKRAGKFYKSKAIEPFIGEADFTGEYAYGMLVNNPWVVVPNHVTKSVLSDDKGIFKDNRVYDGKTAIDKALLYSGTKPAEATAKAEISRRKAQIKVGYFGFDKTMYRKFKSANPELSREEIEEIVKKESKKYFKKLEGGKGKKSAIKRLEDTDWEALEEAFKKRK